MGLPLLLGWRNGSILAIFIQTSFYQFIGQPHRHRIIFGQVDHLNLSLIFLNLLPKNFFGNMPVSCLFMLLFKKLNQVFL
jgi:hypothetical protein